MIELKGISHRFEIGKRGRERVVPVLHDIDLRIAESEIVSIVGRSGSGKSTLLNIISGYIRPSAGSVHVRGRELTKLDESQWAAFRLANYGFIFQSFQLIPSMTAYENVELPMVLQGIPEKKRKRKALALMEQVGLTPYAGHYPGELSGGQQQRVSVARALVLEPPIVLADEPSGSLDSENEKQLLTMIKQLNHEFGITFVIITHDDQVASIAHRTIRLQDGRIVSNAAPQRGGMPI